MLTLSLLLRYSIVDSNSNLFFSSLPSSMEPVSRAIRSG